MQVDEALALIEGGLLGPGVLGLLRRGGEASSAAWAFVGESGDSKASLFVGFRTSGEVSGVEGREGDVEALFLFLGVFFFCGDGDPCFLFAPLGI